MSEAFARKASGLVRQVGLTDAALFAIMNNAIGINLWFATNGALYTFPGANLILGIIIATILAVFGLALTFGILAGSMPRSGGDYVYNSRILHPAIGMAVSFANGGFIMTAWIWILGPWTAQVGLPILYGTVGTDPGAVTFWSSTPVGLFIATTIVNFLSFAAVAFGLGNFFKFQRVALAVAFLGVFIAGIILTVTPHAVFVSTWDRLAAQYGSLGYGDMITTVKNTGYPIGQGWNWVSTIGSIVTLSWVVFFGSMATPFIAGEIKKPGRNAPMSIALSAIIPACIYIWIVSAMMQTIGYDFMSAAAYANWGGLEGYTMPFPATYVNFAAILTNNTALKLLMGVNFIIFNFLWIPFSYITFSRAAFAWGMDRIGPLWFTDVHPRFASTVKLYLLAFVIGELGIAVYCFYPTALMGINVTVLQFLSVYGVTGISIIVFPFLAKTRHIWDASPYRKYGKALPVMAGIIQLITTAIMIWASYAAYGMGMLSMIWTPVYIIVWVVALCWYWYWKSKRKREGIDVTLAFKELAPE
jgi:amino acid transporter